jgi:hypothetical protein
MNKSTISSKLPEATIWGTDHIRNLLDVEFVTPRLSDFDNFNENINVHGDGMLLHDQLFDDARLESVGGFFGGILLVAFVGWRGLFGSFEELDELLEDVLVPARRHLCDSVSGLADDRGEDGEAGMVVCVFDEAFWSVPAFRFMRGVRAELTARGGGSQ